MKTILRNFFSVLRRFKAATLLNVLGLSIAFVAFMLIMMTPSTATTGMRSLYSVWMLFGADRVHRPLSTARLHGHLPNHRLI